MSTEITSAMVKLGILILVAGWGAFIQWDIVSKTYKYFWVIGFIIFLIGLILDFAYFQGRKDGLKEKENDK